MKSCKYYSNQNINAQIAKLREQNNELKLQNQCLNEAISKKEQQSSAAINKIVYENSRIMEQIATIGRNVKAIKTSRFASYLSPKPKKRTTSYSFSQYKDTNTEPCNTSEVKPEINKEIQTLKERLQEIQNLQEKHSLIISESTSFYEVMKDILYQNVYHLYNMLQYPLQNYNLAL